MARPKKKPDYNPSLSMETLMKSVAAAFGSPYDDREERDPGEPSLRNVAEEFDTTILKVRKLLITAEVYSTKVSREVNRLYCSGMKIPQIMEQTGLSRASVHSYIPYSRIAYNMEESSLNADRHRLFRKRRAACEALKNAMDSIMDSTINSALNGIVNNSMDSSRDSAIDMAMAEEALWSALEAFQRYPFRTDGDLSFTYTIKNGGLFVDCEEKVINRETVMTAFYNALNMQKQYGCVSGPDKLGAFGGSYLYPLYMYPIFLRLGICGKR